MGFTINGNNLPAIRNFKQAEEFFGNRRCPHTWYGNTRPLYNSRATHLALKKINSLAGGDEPTAYQCILYSTPVITYHRDGSTTIRTRATQSTANFINAMSRFTAMVYAGRMWVRRNSDEWYAGSQEPLHFNADGVCTNPTTVMVKVLDKKKATQARAKLKEFVEFCRAARRLTGIANILTTPSVNSIADDLPPREEWGSIVLSEDSIKSLYNAAYAHEGCYNWKTIPAGTLPPKGSTFILTTGETE